MRKVQATQSRSEVRKSFPPLGSLVPKERRSRDYVVIGVAPGETTGVCCFHGCELFDARQLKTKCFESAVEELAGYISVNTPKVVSYEDYRVYAWESEKHKWAGLHTPQIIGAVRTLCVLEEIECVGRMAQAAKTFVTDEKLTAWGLYQRGMRHSRDAIRHAVYHLVFGK